MGNAARKARKKSGEKFTPKPAKTPTVRYTKSGRRITGIPEGFTEQDLRAIMSGAEKIRAKMDADIRALQFPN